MGVQKNTSSAESSRKGKSPDIITLKRKASLTGHALPFTGIILSVRFYIL